MKKTITLFAVFLLLSCSKDDSSMPVTFQNLTGVWKIKSIVRVNGTVVPYTGLCPTKEDYLEIFNYRKIQTYNYFPNCVDINDFGCDAYSLDTNGTLIYSGGPIFDEASVSNLSKSGFKIEYPEVKNLTFMIDVTDAIAVNFVKKE